MSDRPAGLARSIPLASADRVVRLRTAGAAARTGHGWWAAAG
jgi:hypothetical protein